MSTSDPQPAPHGGVLGLLHVLVRPSPSPPRLGISVQAGIAMLLTVGLPALAGRADLGLLASTGALSALYLSARSRRERLRRLPLVQLGLLAAVALGAAPRGDPVAAPVVLVLVGIAAVVLATGTAVGPPGALFPVLGAGVAGRLTGPRSAGGAGLDPLLVIGCAVGGAVLAYLIVAAPLAVPAVRRSDRARPVEPVRFALDPAGRTVVVWVSVAVVLAALLAAVLGIDRGYWVVVAVVSVLQGGRGRRVTGVRAVHRVGGTLVGALLFVLVAALIGLPAQGLALAVVLALLQFGAEMVIVAHYGAALLLVTPLACSSPRRGPPATRGPSRAPGCSTPRSAAASRWWSWSSTTRPPACGGVEAQPATTVLRWAPSPSTPTSTTSPAARYGNRPDMATPSGVPVSRTSPGSSRT